MAHRTSSPTCKTRTSPTTPRPTPASPPSRTNPTVATSPSTPSAATAVTPSATRTPSPSTPSARMSSPPSSPPTPHFLFLYSIATLISAHGCWTYSRQYVIENEVLVYSKCIICTMLHPWYGFLAENAGFVDICREHGINFIGPNEKDMCLENVYYSEMKDQFL
ncbi:multiple epidermal growth factor-like domains protein 9 isoform X1 [Asparagus officinalis]|uniref:multiple epidermal growth factor-like domains protein 9 isoform X1 n=1 Tax=Asparagus officinalis TaxID=4686 RepID=UPI00098E422A|nr:multiple epidermal growth factor-like domains protein 9 isoform X1 [Asparagus officinalis]